MTLWARRPDPAAPRPYDNDFLPATAVNCNVDGLLDCAAFQGAVALGAGF